MKILIVSDQENIKTEIQKRFKVHGAELMHYWHPIKAMDNLDELEPDVIFFNGQDFPRHWKTFLTFLRGFAGKEKTVFILLLEDEKNEEEVQKAIHLGANGIFNYKLKENSELQRLKDVISRYKNLSEIRRHPRYIPGKYDIIQFICQHPENLNIIPGDVIDISLSGLHFRPKSVDFLEGIDSGAELTPCSLKIGSELFTLNCEVVRAEKALHLVYTEPSGEMISCLRTYFANRSARELAEISS